ncbi:uncharacterized protein LOC127355824 isoform X3 [Dicentrarchus labrax]|uniref:uncharacterized protein LOC127355824 isoform X3 n=1 Tax=Dicentrarchus labrax TaxID=13489 RepID=UPI0021F55B73|nr:uncharacterized protein LOC127355824 isoform X3 [Dicentrarchus labrax]
MGTQQPSASTSGSDSTLSYSSCGSTEIILLFLLLLFIISFFRVQPEFRGTSTDENGAAQHGSVVDLSPPDSTSTTRSRCR